MGVRHVCSLGNEQDPSIPLCSTLLSSPEITDATMYPSAPCGETEGHTRGRRHSGSTAASTPSVKIRVSSSICIGQAREVVRWAVVQGLGQFGLLAMVLVVLRLRIRTRSNSRQISQRKWMVSPPFLK